MHKRLVAGLSRLVTCLQSNFIGTNFAGFCSNLGVHGLFSSPFVSYWVHIDWLAPGYLMGGFPPFHGKPKPRSQPPVSPSPGSPTRIRFWLAAPLVPTCHFLWCYDLCVFCQKFSLLSQAQGFVNKISQLFYTNK